MLGLLTFQVTYYVVFFKPKEDTPYPALQRLVTNVDAFLWSRFDISTLTEDLSDWTDSDAVSGFEPVSPLPEVDISPKDFCPLLPPELQGELFVQFDPEFPPAYDVIAKANKHLSFGGRYKPPQCSPRYKLAIIVPYRDREKQLFWFLSHIHPILQRQMLEYAIYVVNQAPGALFNRGKLMNVGFAEASKRDRYDCYVFHDVDLLAENDMCLYHCPEFAEEARSNPKHLSVSVDKFKYEALHYELGLCSPVPYQASEMQVFGGVAIFTEDQFISVNGFSNSYWGWGAEDDDLFLRTWRKGYKIDRSHMNECSFHMLPHDQETKNPKSPMRYVLLKQSLLRQNTDGLNSLKYRLLNKTEGLLYTNITVDIAKPSDKVFELMDLMKEEFGTESQFSCFEALVWMYNRLPTLEATKSKDKASGL
ncbi:unnamed protein product [Clavelina lepadiformis]|uniref:Beta-1,4-galactosyltransferase n=1 Tax=Clavelina lepadiformis TaxID=159417 RepID=A0ABP0FPN2_CLALP